MTRRAAAAVALSLLLAGGGTAAADGPPPFSPDAYFAGVTRAAGTMTDGFGRPTSRFTGTTRGRRERDGSTSFDQVIRFDDGTVRSRTWRIVRTGRNSVEATGTDLVGVARGELEGRTLRLRSTVRVDPDNPLSDVDFEQVMTLAADGRALDNSSTIRKFGLVVRRAEERFVRAGRRDPRSGAR